MRHFIEEHLGTLLALAVLVALLFMWTIVVFA